MQDVHALLAGARRRRLPRRRDRPAAQGPGAARRSAGRRAVRRCRSARRTARLDAPVLGQRARHRRRRSAAIREACGDAFLVGEVYLPSAALAPYLEHLDAAFAFELLHCAAGRRSALRAAIEACTRSPGAAWVLSNHDFGRLATRFGARERPRRRAAAAHAARARPSSTRATRSGRARARPASRRFDRAGRDRTATRCSGTARRRRLHDRRAVAAGSSTRPTRNVADQRDDPARC